MWRKGGGQSESINSRLKWNRGGVMEHYKGEPDLHLRSSWSIEQMRVAFDDPKTKRGLGVCIERFKLGVKSLDYMLYAFINDASN